ncbi:vpr protein [Simian immunodeficiency virus]|uniref:Vpr protein n=1 Tax=Simian immunodeficiency virus TaxID=11723 RepID=Q03239_SIV|nr:vpr protein [Simian immunodeficiency virus]
MAEAFFNPSQHVQGTPWFFIPRNVELTPNVINVTVKAELVVTEASKHFTPQEIYGVWNQSLNEEAGTDSPTMAWERTMLDMVRALNLMLFEHFAAGCPQRTRYARHRGYPHPS